MRPRADQTVLISVKRRTSTENTRRKSTEKRIVRSRRGRKFAREKRGLAIVIREREQQQLRITAARLRGRKRNERMDRLFVLLLASLFHFFRRASRSFTNQATDLQLRVRKQRRSSMEMGRRETDEPQNDYRAQQNRCECRTTQPCGLRTLHHETHTFNSVRGNCRKKSTACSALIPKCWKSAVRPPSVNEGILPNSEDLAPYKVRRNNEEKSSQGRGRVAWFCMFTKVVSGEKRALDSNHEIHVAAAQPYPHHRQCITE